MSEAAVKTLKVFCSYSHKDEVALSELRTHLSSLRFARLIEDWHDRKIPTGGDWDKEISDALEAADLVLLLISSDFIHSKYCMEVETARALERHDAKEATAIPIFLRECVVTSLPFERIQGTPRDMRWINQQSHRDKAWSEVTEAIREAALTRLGQSQTNQYQINPIAAFPETSLDTCNPEEDNGGEAPKQSWARPWLVGLLLIVIALAAGLKAWSWFKPDDVVTQQGKRALQQGEYALARQHCEAAPASQFKGQCIAVTNLALDKEESRDAFFTAAKKEGSAYSKVLMGSYRLADYDAGNNAALNEAEEYFREAVQENNQLLEAYFSLGLINQLKNRPNEAIPHYKKAQALARNNSRYALNIATALADAERFSEAESALRNILSGSANVMMAHAELIEVLVKQGKRAAADKAITRARILLDTEPDLSKDPVNSVEWFVMVNGEPQYLQAWEEKLVYFRCYLFPMAQFSEERDFGCPQKTM